MTPDLTAAGAARAGLCVPPAFVRHACVPLAAFGWFGLAAGGALAATAPAGAGQVPGASAIERVTVYPGLALVERSARVSSGARELVLDCLSAGFDMSSLQVEGSEGVRVGPVSAWTRPRSEAPACDSSPLDGAIRTLEDRLALLQAESSGHDLVLGLLRGLAAPEAGASAPAARLAAPAQAAGLQALLNTVQRSGQDALGQQHRLAREREALERELQPLLSERERLRGQSGEVRQLRISLAGSREGAVSLRYQVPGPTWAPAYRATLDTSAPGGASVQVERLAQVSQRSGEDWRGVNLRLSTGSPRGASAGPQPRSWEVFPRPPLAALPQLKAAMAAPAPMALRAAAPESADAALPDDAPMEFAVQQVEGEFATEFEVPGRVDVASGSQRVSLALGQQRLPARLWVRTVPQQDASAWLVAEGARPEGVWPDGPVQLMRGSQVVGSSVWRQAEGERFSLPFGRDEQVRVRVLPAQQATGSGGFIGSRQERKVARVYEVENRHRSAVDLQVLEASPVSTDEQIQVTRQFTPAPQPGFWQDQPGVVAWQTPLAPGQKARFAADYVISHPRDLAVQERR